MFDIKIDMSKYDRIVSKLKKIPNGTWRPQFLIDIASVLIGNGDSGLRRYATYRKITRKSVYGSSFKTPAQQRGFFAKLNSGEISVPFHRTGAQGKAWHTEGVTATKVTVSNRTQGVVYTRGQTLFHKAMGWLSVKEQTNSDLPGAKMKAIRNLIQWLRNL